MGDDSCDDVSDGQSSGIFEKNPSILTKSEGATSENTESTPKIQYTLTPEEAQLKALELQKKLRNVIIYLLYRNERDAKNGMNWKGREIEWRWAKPSNSNASCLLNRRGKDRLKKLVK